MALPMRRRGRWMHVEYRLGEYLFGVAVRRLVGKLEKSEADKLLVFNGTDALVSIFGASERNGIPARFLLKQDEKEMRSAAGYLNWQSLVNVASAKRKFRLTFENNAVMSLATRGDDIYFLMQPEGSAIVVLAQEGSTMQCQLRWLLKVNSTEAIGFSAKRFRAGRTNTSLSERLVLEELGAA